MHPLRFQSSRRLSSVHAVSMSGMMRPRPTAYRLSTVLNDSLGCKYTPAASTTWARNGPQWQPGLQVCDRGHHPYTDSQRSSITARTASVRSRYRHYADSQRSSTDSSDCKYATGVNPAKTPNDPEGQLRLQVCYRGQPHTISQRSSRTTQTGSTQPRQPHLDS